MGVAVGLAYGGSAVLVAALALRQDTPTFMALYFGGMFVRMLLALAAVAAIIMWLRAAVPVFAAALLGAWTLALVLEILWLVRRRSRPV